MANFTIKEIPYQSRAMDLFVAWRVLKRLGPFAPSLTVLWKAEETDTRLVDALPLLVPPLLQTFAQMTDTDAEYVRDQCFHVTQTFREGLWGSLIAPESRRLQYQDIGLFEMASICFCVLRENLSPFYADLKAMAMADRSKITE